MKYPKRSQYKYAKSPYRIRNWPDYEAGLRRRGRGCKGYNGGWHDRASHHFNAPHKLWGWWLGPSVVGSCRAVGEILARSEAMKPPSVPAAFGASRFPAPRRALLFPGGSHSENPEYDRSCSHCPLWHVWRIRRIADGLDGPPPERRPPSGRPPTDVTARPPAGSEQS